MLPRKPSCTGVPGKACTTKVATPLNQRLLGLMLSEDSEGAKRFSDRDLRDFAAYMSLIVAPETLDSLDPGTQSLIEDFLRDVGGGDFASPDQTRAYFAENLGYREVLRAAGKLLEDHASEGSQAPTEALRFLGNGARPSNPHEPHGPSVSSGPTLMATLRDIPLS